MEFVVSRIGIFDPQEKLAARLNDALLQRGFLSDIIRTPDAVEAYCLRLRPSGLLLDLCDCPPDAPDRMKRLRQAGFNAPTIAFVTNECDIDRLKLLEAGANDILPATETTSGILDRLDFIFARYTAAQKPPPAHNVEQRFYESLTPTELRILSELKATAPKPMSRDALTWAISRRSVSPDERSLDVHISSIRRKIRLTKAPLSIETVRGVGFLYKEKGSFLAADTPPQKRRA